MGRIIEFLSRLLGFLRRPDSGNELDEEIRSHLEMLEHDNLRHGMTPTEARLAARRSFGGIERSKESWRDQRTLPTLEGLFQDLRYGVRGLRRNPVFTVTAILTLALGIGATSAIFSVVDHVLLRDLPYPDSARLMTVYGTNPRQGQPHVPLSIADFLDWRAGNHAFAHVAAYARTLLIFSGKEGPEQMPALGATADFFNVLGVKAEVGRTFVGGDDQPETPGAAVVNHAFYVRYLNSDPGRLGQALAFGSRSYVIVGVMPPDFRFGLSDEPGVWTAMKLTAPARRGPYFLAAIARLKTGVSEQQARADMEHIANSVRLADKSITADWSLTAINTKDELVGDVRDMVLVFAAAVGFVLLIACGNVANLLLSRAVVREREFAVRRALGASQTRLVRQVLSESLLLSAAGGVCGTAIAYGLVQLVLMFGPDSIPRLNSVSLDSRILLFTVAISLVTGVIAGLAPAFQGLHGNLTAAFKEGGWSGSSSLRKQWLREALVISEVALSMILLLGAGLLIKSFLKLEMVDVGIRPENLVTLQISGTLGGYQTRQQLASFFKELVARTESIPGVRAAATNISLPPDVLQVSDDFSIEGRPLPEGSSNPIANLLLISPGYFRTVGSELIRGRGFTDADTADTTGVVIINETLAKRFFPGEDPIGKRVRQNSNPWLEIVGIAPDIRYSGVQSPPDPAIYEPQMQNPGSPAYLIVRTTGDPMSVVPLIRAEMARINPAVPIFRIKLLADYLYESKAEPRFRTLLLVGFSTMALMLTLIGIYGVMSYTVSQHTHEIGIRRALGAESTAIARMVLRNGMKLAAMGIAIGVTGALILTRLMSGLLFNVSGTDPLTFVVVPLVLAATALLAGYAPARRASRVDPVVALRHE